MGRENQDYLPKIHSMFPPMLTVKVRSNLMCESGLMDTGPVFSGFGASTSNNGLRPVLCHPHLGNSSINRHATSRLDDGFKGARSDLFTGTGGNEKYVVRLQIDVR